MLTPPVIPDTAIAGIRTTMDLMTAPYLARRGRKLYCDKSLGTAVYADLLLRIYPGARFICLYRHPTDMISSGLEACPWGLNGYGFDRYIAESPGNSVMALARYWLDGATAIATVEEEHPGSCHRVRYEDLVANPERVAEGIFRFLGVEDVPGIAKTVFRREHERFGPADHKVWYTSEISQRSVGRSDSLPVGLIPPPVLESINELLAKLGYVQVDERWGTADMPSSLLAEDDATDAGGGQAGSLAGTEILGKRLSEGLAGLDAELAVGWQSHMEETFTAVIREPHAASRIWTVDLSTGKVISGKVAVADSVDAADGGGESEEDWSIIGTAEAWLRLLDGDLNMSTALRRNELRYCDYGENDFFVTEARITLLAALLGTPALADNASFHAEPVPALSD